MDEAVSSALSAPVGKLAPSVFAAPTPKGPLTLRRSLQVLKSNWGKWKTPTTEVRWPRVQTGSVQGPFQRVVEYLHLTMLGVGGWWLWLEGPLGTGESELDPFVSTVLRQSQLLYLFRQHSFGCRVFPLKATPAWMHAGVAASLPLQPLSDRPEPGLDPVDWSTPPPPPPTLLLSPTIF